MMSTFKTEIHPIKSALISEKYYLIGTHSKYTTCLLIIGDTAVF